MISFPKAGQHNIRIWQRSVAQSIEDRNWRERRSQVREEPFQPRPQDRPFNQALPPRPSSSIGPIYDCVRP